MLLYLLLVPIIYLLSRFAEKRKSFKYLIVVIIVLTFVSGFRAEEVGIDTKDYIERLEYVSKGHPEFAYGFEKGFVLLAIVVISLFGSVTSFLVVLAFITNWFIIRRLWDYKNISSVPCMILSYYTAYYFYSMNITRQLCAVAVIFYFSRFICEKKYLLFISIVLLCTFFFHQSSIVCIIFVIVDAFDWKSLSKSQKRILGCGILISPFAIVYVWNHLLNRYLGYFDLSSVRIGFMVLVKIIFVIFSYFLIRKSLFIGQKICVAERGLKYNTKSIMVYFTIGLVLSALGYIFTYVDRIGLYFKVYECVYYGIITKKVIRNEVCGYLIEKYKINDVYRIIFIFVIVFLLGYGFITDLLFNSQGNVPYSLNFS